jgi:FlaG/FlaF family flagellin (archaellin)
MGMIEKRRGVSTFIAVLLLMALAVSAGVVIYSYTMGYLGGLGGTSLPGALSLDTATCDESTSTMTAYIRNIGKGSFTLSSAYVDGILVPTGNMTQSPALLTEGNVAQLDIVYWSFTAPTSYEIKIIGKDNTQLTFNVKCK